MTGLVGYMLLFVGIGVFFVFIHLMMGRLVRPIKPDPEKLTIYECGEPTIGSAWIQFDLRFYVVALLFVIFDVEVAFFFPWAVVFGKAVTVARPDVPVEQRVATAYELDPGYLAAELKRSDQLTALRQQPPGPARDEQERVVSDSLARMEKDAAAAARDLAWFAVWDIAVFFGVLLVGFAYLWKRGDLDWVRSTAAERLPLAEEPLALPAEPGVLVGAGTASVSSH